MRYLVGVLLLMCFVTSCFTVPTYDDELNPFMEEFDDSFVDITKIENGYDERNGLLSYRVFFRLNESVIPPEAQRVEIHVEDRPDDHFFFYIPDSASRTQELSFYDQKVELGATHTYSFHLGYKKYLSQPSNPSFELKVEKP